MCILWIAIWFNIWKNGSLKRMQRSKNKKERRKERLVGSHKEIEIRFIESTKKKSATEIM